MQLTIPKDNLGSNDEQTVLFVQYVGTNIPQVHGLPNNFDIKEAISKLSSGYTFSQAINNEYGTTIKDIRDIGFMFFSRGTGKANVWEYSEKSLEIFPKTERILERGQLENILKKTRNIRGWNKWIPFLNMSINYAKPLCDGSAGDFQEDFILNHVLSKEDANQFYVDIPYWSSYKPIQKTDLILPLEKFLKVV